MAFLAARLAGLVLLGQGAAGFLRGGPGMAVVARSTTWQNSLRAVAAVQGGDSIISSSSSSSNSEENDVYGRPDLYDLAFSYRDFDAEVYRRILVIFTLQVAPLNHQ
jgi:hypothetical protein